MLRKFTDSDIAKHQNIKILEHTRPDGSKKDYLFVERRPFISALVSIDGAYTILVEQFRPVIGVTTLEIPMGKLEKDESPEQALFRELQEELSLHLDAAPKLEVLSDGKPEFIEFGGMEITSYEPEYVSPGFSNSICYPFTVNLVNPSRPIDCCSLHPKEEGLTLHLKEINSELADQLSGISRYSLIEFLYNKLEESIEHQKDCPAPKE